MPGNYEHNARNGTDLAPKGGPSGGKEGGTLTPEFRGRVGKAVEYHDSALSKNACEAYQRGWENLREFCDSHGLETASATEQAVALSIPVHSSCGSQRRPRARSRSHEEPDGAVDQPGGETRPKSLRTEPARKAPPALLSDQQRGQRALSAHKSRCSRGRRHRP